MRRIATVGILALVLGCQSRLDFEKSIHVDSGSIHTLDVSPPRYDQQMTVTVGTNAPVNVHIYLTRDKDHVEKDLTLKGKSTKTLADWSGDSSGTLEVTVPAHQVAMIRIEAEKRAADVSVKVVAK